MMRRAAPVVAAALALAAAPASAQAPARIAAALRSGGFQGEALVAQGKRVLYATPPAACPPHDGRCRPRDPADLRWPWASVSKQVLAILVMQEVERGHIRLDAAAATYLPALGTGAASPSVRQLLRHQAGLRNPDDTPRDGEGMPAFYREGPGGAAWCLGDRRAAGGPWRYNNCDYIVLGALLERVTGRDIPRLVAERIARPLGLRTLRYIRVKDATETFAVPPDTAERTAFDRIGTGGALSGSARDLLAIDEALLDGRLLGPVAREELWRGDPALGYMALGQWAFSAPLTGCTGPVRIIERPGAVGRFQARNIILPERGISVILFTPIGEDRYDFGEIWQGRGVTHDILAAAACA